MRGFLVRNIFKNFCFLTNKYGRPASTETTSIVINAYFIGNAQEVCSTRFDSRAVIEADVEYFKGPFHKYFAYCRHTHAVALRAYSLHKSILIVVLDS